MPALKAQGRALIGTTANPAQLFMRRPVPTAGVDAELHAAFRVLCGKQRPCHRPVLPAGRQPGACSYNSTCTCSHAKNALAPSCIQPRCSDKPKSETLLLPLS